MSSLARRNVIVVLVVLLGSSAVKAEAGPDSPVASIEAGSGLGLKPMEGISGNAGFFVLRTASYVPEHVVFEIAAEEIQVRVIEIVWTSVELPGGLVIDYLGQPNEIASFNVSDGSVALDSLREFASVYARDVQEYVGNGVGAVTALPPIDSSAHATQTFTHFDVSDLHEPFPRDVHGPLMPVRVDHMNAVSGDLNAATVYNGTLRIQAPGGSHRYDPYDEDNGPMAPNQVPLRWMELDAPNGTFEFSVSAQRRDLIEATLFTSSLAGSGVRSVWVTAGDGTVAAGDDVFEARGSMLYAEGNFTASLAAAGDDPGSPRTHLELYGEPELIRTSEGLWQASPAAAASTAIGLAAVLAVVAVVFRETVVRAASAVSLPFYTKLKKPQLLDHERRQALHDVIKEEPGVTFLQLHQRLKELFAKGGGYGFGSLTYHLSQLERFGLIVSKREGRFRRYFENGSRFGRDTVRIALLQTPPIPELVAALLKEPGASQTTLHGAIKGTYDVSRQTVGYHLKRLSEKDLVEVVRNGRANAYHPTQKLRELGEFAVARTQSLRDLDASSPAPG